jgi:hypothetical protein
MEAGCPWQSSPADRDTVLRALGVDPHEIAGIEELGAGLSGARIQRLTLRHEIPGGAGGYCHRVVKWLAPERGWLGAASCDTAMREARLWASGVLADLPHGIETATLAAVESSDPGEQARSAALLMRDVSSRLLRDPIRTPPGQLSPSVLGILDGMARIHARFWEDARLNDPSLGLTPPKAALLLTAPDTIRARIAGGDADPYLPLAMVGWEAFFRLATPADAETLRAVLRAPEPWLATITRLPRTLLHGDVWGPNLGFLPPTRIAPRRGRRLLLLDWALAAAGPATYDPLWLCGTWHALSPPRVLAAYRARLARHLSARRIHLVPHIWRALVDAAYLRTTLTCGEAFGRAAHEAPPGAARRRAEMRVRWWARRASQAARRLRPATTASE